VSKKSQNPYPLVTHDPFTGEELTVTRLENKSRGLVLEGEFSLGWIAKLSTEQLEFAGVLLRYRGNVQKLASEMGVAYNTARSRLDDIVEALGGSSEPEPNPEKPKVNPNDILSKLEAGQVGFEDALAALKRK
jgi:hypothetical protein